MYIYRISEIYIQPSSFSYYITIFSLLRLYLSIITYVYILLLHMFFSDTAFLSNSIVNNFKI